MEILCTVFVGSKKSSVIGNLVVVCMGFECHFVLILRFRGQILLLSTDDFTLSVKRNGVLFLWVVKNPV